MGIRKCYVPDADDGEGAIVLPETYKDRTTVCVIEAIGPDCQEFRAEHLGAYVKASGNLMGANDQFRNTVDPRRETWIVKESVFIDGRAGASPGIWVEDD